MHSHPTDLSRRDFIRQASLSGLALTIGAYLPSFDRKGNEAGSGAPRIVNAALLGGSGPDGADPAIELMSWISIDSSGKVTIFNHRSEMGQGTFQSLPQIVAEELEVDPGQVHVRFAPANPKKFGPQPQAGSFSVRGWREQLLHAGASAREMLIEAAAEQWRVPATECYAINGEVHHRPTGRKSGYGALVKDASRLNPPSEVKLKDRKDYKVIGRPLPRKDIPSKVDGTAVFGLDKTLPGMLYAVVERNPRFRGKVKTFDSKATLAITGVKRVFTVQRAVFGDLYEGVAVVADSIWAAMKGRRALKVEWDDEGFEHFDSELLLSRMREGLATQAGELNASSIRFETEIQKAAQKIEAVYETPYQSHSCMEPLNCTAHVQDDRIEIWGPIQEVNWIQADLSQRMGVALENVSVNMTFLGGGFGRKAFTDYPHEAALISREMKAPVQVVWTREDDMTAGPYRPGAVYACKGGLDSAGHILAFQARRASQPMGPGGEGGAHADYSPVSYNSGYLDGLARSYLTSIPHYSFADVSISSSIPAMWWRSVDASTNGFAVESFVDELANAAGKDALAFRREHFADARYQALIDRLGTLSGWKADGKEKGWGLAVTECFGSIVGHVVKVSHRPDRKIKIDKITALIDCGWYVNPDIIRAQVEGAIVMGLGAAIKHETHFKDGKAVENNFHTYKMPRINDIPAVEVFIMENDEKAGGVGEPGLPPIAPALCNAIFDLTGRRIRKLPFDPDAV
ncbi:xanthine dehydrogenase family protein molybdopterin-binding subunit [Puia dinghuensis]|uniref:Oxidoreductase n=1 Tax=Puia dinghuensis TaxID=1792502 RepID=A0A8J2XQT7_9BACT|nr:molybdopterin cofactor-binding domain-containing protein [Puia dinghuensis]GGA96061.1 oxidoreductase [Puia dinghuensis]